MDYKIGWYLVVIWVHVHLSADVVCWNRAHIPRRPVSHSLAIKMVIMEAKRLQRLIIFTRSVCHVISELSRFVVFALFFIFILVFRLHNVSATGMLEMQPNEKLLSVTQPKVFRISSNRCV